MAQKNDDSAEKTEQPTPRRLLDARKRGEVSKSRDITSTVELVVWFALAAGALSYAGREFMALIELALRAVDEPFALAAPSVGQAAARALLALTALVAVPVAAVGILSQFLQTGPVFSLEKLKPNFTNLNLAQGLKRMFSVDRLVELLKAVFKTAVLLGIGWIAITTLLPDLAKLPGSQQPDRVGAAMWAAARTVLGWTLLLFAILSILDGVYQRWSFLKKMRMSRRELKQEVKEHEGDPYIKAKRRQTRYEWAQRSAVAAAKAANVLVVNPTHVAIAIEYDREACPVPTVSAKGEAHEARAMREAAAEAGVPILRNVPLARDLLATTEPGDLIPEEFFDIIADVILWAREVRAELERQSGPASDDAARTPRRAAPGEDLTRYGRESGLDHAGEVEPFSIEESP